MATRTKKETPEQKLARWCAGSVKGVRLSEIEEMGWEAGQEAYWEYEGLRYEKFDLPTGGYVVVEWDEEGNVIVL